MDKSIDTATRIMNGEMISRPKHFEEMMRIYRDSAAELSELVKCAKEYLPADIDVKFLADDEENSVYIVAERWEAKIIEAELDGGGRSHLMWFEDSTQTLGVPAGPQWKRTIEEKNIVLTAVEKAFLVLDSKTRLRTRFASTAERGVSVGKRKKDLTFAPTDIGEVFGIIAEKGFLKAANAYGKKHNAIKNKVYEETEHSELPLIIMYSGTPALPDECVEDSKKTLVEMGFSADAVSPLGYTDDDFFLKGVSKQTLGLVDKGLGRFGLSREELASLAVDDVYGTVKASLTGMKNTMKETYQGNVSSQSAQETLPVARFCANCGNALNSTAKFCSRCGKAVE